MTNKAVARKDDRHVIAPAVDVLENETEYLVVADVPGVRSEDVHCEFNDGEISFRAQSNTSAGVDLFSGERTVYEYGRRFRVPNGVDIEKITAELTNGVLRLHIPKGAARMPRQIPVTA